MSKENTTNHSCPLDRKRKCDILNDRELILNGGKTKIKWQIFSKAILGLSSLNLSKKMMIVLGKVNLRLCLNLLNKNRLKVGSILHIHQPFGSSRVIFCPRLM